MFERKGLSPLFLCVFTAVLCLEAWTVRTALQTFAGSLVPHLYPQGASFCVRNMKAES